MEIWLLGCKVLQLYEKLCHIKNVRQIIANALFFKKINNFRRSKKWFKNNYNMFFHKKTPIG